MKLIPVTSEMFTQIVDRVKITKKKYFKLPFFITYAEIERNFQYAELMSDDTIEIETKSGIKLQLISHNRCITCCGNIIPCKIDLKYKNKI